MLPVFLLLDVYMDCPSQVYGGAARSQDRSVVTDLGWVSAPDPPWVQRSRPSSRHFLVDSGHGAFHRRGPGAGSTVARGGCLDQASAVSWRGVAGVGPAWRGSRQAFWAVLARSRRSEILSGDRGKPVMVTPKGESASATALTTAGGAPMAPPSPTPL